MLFKVKPIFLSLSDCFLCPFGNRAFGFRRVCTVNRKTITECRSGTELFQIALAASKSAALVSHDCHHLFARKIQLFELCKDRHRECSPPARTADKYIIVFVDIIEVLFQLWSCAAVQLTLSLVNTGIIICRVGLNGIDLKQIAADRFPNELSYDLRIALFNAFYIAVPVVFALAGVIR